MARLKVHSVFSNHNEFKEALDLYSKETFTTWVFSHSKTIAKRNQEMRANEKTEHVQPLDEVVGLYFANYRCKHAGEVRRRGKGIRPNQSTYKKACPAKMYLAYSGKEKGLVLKDLQEDHNHELSRVSYLQHPEQRCLSGEKMEKVATLIENGVTVHHIQEYLRTKEDHILTAKDVHNLAQKLKSDKRQDRSEEQILIDKLHNLQTEDPGLAVSIAVTENGVLEYILLQTSQMRETFRSFGEVLFLDATYNTNRLRWPLLSFLVQDGHGRGQPVCYVLVNQETNDTVDRFVENFVQLVDISSVQTVIVDKDSKEIRAIAHHIPSASIQLCKFHVMQAFQRHITKNVKGEDTETILAIVRSIVYAKTEESFNKALDKFTETSPENVVTYYRQNWDGDRSKWAKYLTDNKNNLGNTTNNRLESHNSRLKLLLNRRMTLTEVITALVSLYRDRCQENLLKNEGLLSKIRYTNGEDDLVSVWSELTPYALGIIQGELIRAKTHVDKLLREICKCPPTQLPCRHFLARRLYAGDKPVISIGDIDDRWLVKSQCVVPLKRPPPMHMLSAPKRAKLSQRPRTKAEKFKAVMQVATSIADFASGLGTVQFCETLDTLHQVLEIWNSGDRVVITPSLKDTLPEEDPAQHTENPGPAQHVENPETAENPDPAHLPQGSCHPQPSDFPAFKLPQTPLPRGKPSLSIRKCRPRTKKVTSKATDLTPSELQDVLDGKLLTDRHIHASQLLLKDTFPEVNGLQDPVLGAPHNGRIHFQICPQNFLQIFHDPRRSHWFLGAAQRDEKSFHVYGSMISDSQVLGPAVMMQVSALMHLGRGDREIAVVREPVQQQTGFTDCGLFAIAFATDICFGEDVNSKKYNQSQLRPHFIDCLRKGEMSHFPSLSSLTSKRSPTCCSRHTMSSIPVYCVCRLSDNEAENMIGCDVCGEWFHQSCLGLSTSEFHRIKLGDWLCDVCMQVIAAEVERAVS